MAHLSLKILYLAYTESQAEPFRGSNMYILFTTLSLLNCCECHVPLESVVRDQRDRACPRCTYNVCIARMLRGMLSVKPAAVEIDSGSGQVSERGQNLSACLPTGRL